MFEILNKKTFCVKFSKYFYNLLKIKWLQILVIGGMLLNQNLFAIIQKIVLPLSKK